MTDPQSVAGADGVDGLDVRDLHVTITGEPIDVVSDINFTLAPGEILGLVGESGSGKTTVALALLGYARPGTSLAGGKVIVDSVDLLTLPRSKLRERRGSLVSYVPQDPSSSLSPSLRIGAQIMQVLDEHSFGAGEADRKARLQEVLSEVGLPVDAEFLARYPHQLSGGQQQRIALATAFACRPRVVVLDEPTTGLDVTTQATVLEAVKNLAEIHHVAAVYVTHDLAVVADISTRIAVMYAGRLVEVGPTSTVMKLAAHPYTRRLIEAVPDPKRRRALAGIPGRVAPLGPRRPGCGFADRCEFAEAACRVGAIAAEQVAPEHLVRCRRWQVVRASSRIDGSGNGTPPGEQNGSTDQLLRVDKLAAWYGDNRVLDGASLAIPRGRCLALVGESGSGKTTLARAVSGLHDQASGEVRLGQEVLPWGARNRSPELRRAIQYIFQNPYGSLNPRKNVRELLEQPLKQFKLMPGSDPVPQFLEQVSLSPRYARRYPSQLSGGERQRVAIARALALEPQLLICDEITSALDVSVQASILTLLARLHADTSLTVLFVTHNLAVVRAIADTVVVLDKGMIVEEGTVDEVLDHPKEPYTQTLLANTPGI